MAYKRREDIKIDESAINQCEVQSLAWLSSLPKSSRYVLSFSCGKDSVLLLDIVKKSGLKFVTYFDYIIDGLSYNEEVLQYYEKQGIEINRIESPFVANCQQSDIYLINRVFDVVSVRKEIPLATAKRLIDIIESPDRTFVGIKKNDSPIRQWHYNKSIKEGNSGWLPRDKDLAYPIINWKDNECWMYIYKNNLPVNKCYEWFGRSQDVINYKHVAPLKKYSPKDFDKFLYVFPLLEALVWIKDKRAGKAPDEMIFSKPAKTGNQENYGISLDDYIILCFENYKEKQWYADKFLNDSHSVYIEGDHYCLDKEHVEFKPEWYVSEEGHVEKDTSNDVALIKSMREYKARVENDINCDYFIILYFPSNADKREFCEVNEINPDVNCLDGFDYKIE